MSFYSVVRDSTDSRPKGVDANVLIKISTVIQGNPFKLLEVARELLELSEAPSAFLLDPDLDLTDPSTL